MPVVRLDTYRASAHLVRQLKYAGAAIHEDGGDIIHVGISSGMVSIHLIESPIPAYEVKSTLNYNAANNIHTLFILWGDMLLPPEGDVVQVQEWEWALLDLYGDRIYAYDVFGGEVFIFPVHYPHYGQYREIRYGRTVSMKHLTTGFIETNSAYLKGKWRVAGFDERTQHTGHYHHNASGANRQAPAPQQSGTLTAHYTLLGVELDAEPEDVKTAFRRLARKVHPDVNRSPNATAQMQALNEAYQRIMAQFEDSL